MSRENRNYAIGIGVFLVAVAVGITLVNAAWWDTDWTYKKEMTLNSNLASDLDNAVVFVNFTKTANDEANCESTRILNSTETGGTPRDIYLGACSSETSYAIASLNVDSGAGDQTFYRYYDNSGASNVSTISFFPSKYTMVFTAEGNTTNIVESGNSGTNSGTVIYNATAPMHGKAFDFSGAGHVDLPDAERFHAVNNPWSFAAWVRFHDTSGNIGMLEFGTTESDGGVRLESGVLKGGCNNAGYPAEYTWNPDKERWYHVAYTFVGGAAGEGTLYVDGAEVDQGNAASCSTGGDPDRFDLGQYQGGANADISMDSVFFADAVMTADEVMALANATWTEGAEQDNNNAPIVTVTQPTNSTYLNTTSFDFRFSATDDGNSTFVLQGFLDGNSIYDNSAYSNNTAVLLEQDVGLGGHNFTVRAEDGSEVTTESAFFTSAEYIATYTFNSTPLETMSDTFIAEFEFASNVANISGSLFYDGADWGVDTSTSNASHYVNTKTINIPLEQTNNTAVNNYWLFNLTYTNATTVVENGTVGTSNVHFAYYDPSVVTDSTRYIEGTNVTVNSIIQTLLANAAFLNTVYYNDEFQHTSTARTYSDYYTWFNISSPTPGISQFQGFNSSWNVSFENSFRMMNASTQIESHQFILSTCNSTYPVIMLDIETFEENNRTAMTENVSIDMTFDITNNEIVRNYSFDLDDNTTYTVCMSPVWAEFQVDSTIQYKNDQHPSRSYYFVDATMSNTTTDLNLYLLEDALADLVGFTLRDFQSNFLPDAYIKILRFYPEINEYRTVEIVKTDAQGETPAYMTLFDVFYKFIVDKNSQVLLETDSSLISSANIELTAGSSAELEYFTYTNGIAHSCAFTNSTSTIACSWDDTSGKLVQACLDVTRLSGLQNELIDSSCTASAAGSLGYTIPVDSFNYAYRFYAVTSGNLLNEIQLDADFVDRTGASPFGIDGVFFTLILLISLVGISLIDPRITVVFSILTIVVAFALNILDIGIAGIIGLVVVAFIIFWQMGSKKR